MGSDSYLLKATTSDHPFLGVAAVTTDLVEEARQRHQSYPTATAALGRLLTGALLFGSLLKESQKVLIQVQGNGPLRGLVAEATSEGEVRGYVSRPRAEVPVRGGKLNVGEAVGRKGHLSVIKDIGVREPQRGVVELASGEIAEDLAHYLLQSEQIPSAVSLGVFVETDNSVSAAGGFMVQVLPGGKDGMDGTTLSSLERNIKTLPHVTELVRERVPPPEWFGRIFEGMAFHLIGMHPVSFSCRCSRERVEKTLLALGKEEIGQLISKRKEVEISCDFCAKVYVFTAEEFEGLLKEGAD